ncbi:hypothetical protein AXG93_3352s1050 [Marchantia polymorpha subsp. ruderalis]|uniref:Uncharacterized protein n=1 Tax=Marchantia polymorpha subsp. ruderalis TaxID=1480154 RepID=A0A176VB43_MARPO|nr:hypothetical protein AXG93_3352s1050 [Marchantia polymorpha subsp. ruderalis]
MFENPHQGRSPDLNKPLPPKVVLNLKHVSGTEGLECAQRLSSHSNNPSFTSRPTGNSFLTPTQFFRRRGRDATTSSSKRSRTGVQKTSGFGLLYSTSGNRREAGRDLDEDVVVVVHCVVRSHAHLGIGDVSAEATSRGRVRLCPRADRGARDGGARRVWPPPGPKAHSGRREADTWLGQEPSGCPVRAQRAWMTAEKRLRHGAPVQEGFSSCRVTTLRRAAKSVRGRIDGHDAKRSSRLPKRVAPMLLLLDGVRAALRWQTGAGENWRKAERPDILPRANPVGSVGDSGFGVLCCGRPRDDDPSIIDASGEWRMANGDGGKRPTAGVMSRIDSEPGQTNGTATIALATRPRRKLAHAARGEESEVSTWAWDFGKGRRG